MIERYSRKEMAALWNEEAKFGRWLEVELAACRAMNASGLVPDADWKTIQEKASFDVKRILAIEEVTHHDVVAFLEDVGERVGPAARFIHLGLTSTDIVDTAQSLALVRATALIESGVAKLKAAVRDRALRHRDLVCLGRTHGIHAEPTTYGMKFANWWDELNRHSDRLAAVKERLSVGKLSGAVGTYTETTPELEAAALAHLGLRPAGIATQVLSRDLHAELMTVLAVLAGTLEKMAVEIRHLQRSEVAEVFEPFGAGQKGSSAMPHKRNPVVCERVCGLARVIRGYAAAALENQALWHERDISHSSAERVILGDGFLALDYILEKMRWVIDGLTVREDRVAANLAASRGLVFSSRLLAECLKKGHERKPAYAWVQAGCLAVVDATAAGKPLELADALLATPYPAGPSPLSRDEIARLSSPNDLLGKVAAVFTRLGLTTGTATAG